VINAALLTSAWSASSSDLFTSSRALYGLSLAGNAPRVFSKVSKSGLPYVSVIFCSLFSVLAYMGITAGSGKVFGWFSNMTSVAGLMTWFGICFTYLRFYAGLKAQGIPRSSLPYHTKIQPYAAWWGLGSCFFICLFSGWKVFLKGHWATDAFVTNYITLIGFPILYIGARLVYRSPLVKPADMDFISGIAEIEADTYDEEPPTTAMGKFWAWLM